MEVIGKLKVKGEVQTFGSNGFQKRSVVLDTTEKPEYPQFVSIDLTQDKCSLIDVYNIGDNIKISINIGGRLWVNPQGEEKYFNSITGWRIEKVENAPSTPLPPVADDLIVATNEPESLPF
jgi:hypothetical protein